MEKSIKDIFKINNRNIDFKAVEDYCFAARAFGKLSSLLRRKDPFLIKSTVCNALKSRWDGIKSKEFCCYKEHDGRLSPCHVEAGGSIPYPCVFILNCNPDNKLGDKKEICLRIKIDPAGDAYNTSIDGVQYEYEVSEFFFCNKKGDSLLGFSQMPFLMDLKNLFLSLSEACGKESLTKEDEVTVYKNVYESWIMQGMRKDPEKPQNNDNARHLTFETGLQAKDGRNVRVILWKDAATDNRYEFRVVMGMSSILDQNEADEFDSRPAPAKPVLKSINAGEDIPQDTPTYSFGPNVGGEIMAAQETSGTGKDETEEAFLKRFIAAVEKCGFHYEPQDLIRFHTCVKCGFLTVLGGAPGSGKSSLVKLYASTILGREEGRCRDGMLMVDVNSSWAEPSDILGYWDLKRCYRPSTGVVPFLRKAIRSEHPNIICLEEMNLARVEHYFSDFMQLSEREIAERELKGVPLEPEPEGGDQEKARLPIDKSVRIVGTNNFDQTTQRFSARFFDRCNYIELQDSRKDEDFLFSRPNIDQGNFNCTVSWDTYESWIKKSPRITKVESDKDKGVVIKDENGKEIFGEGIVARFKKIWGALKKLNLKPSPRVESSLIEYVVNRPFIAEYETECDCDCKRQLRVLDEFVAQRILPRYTPSYLIDDSVDRKNLETELADMPLSLKILDEKNRELDGKPHA